MAGEWLFPFRGRNASASLNLNFLWRIENLYVMDNHRAALWCWLQHQDPNAPHSLLHVDAHYDTAGSIPEAVSPNRLQGMKLDEYLNIPHPNASECRPIPLFRWDNYLSIYADLYGESVSNFLFATHKKGTPPSFDFEHIEPEELLGALTKIPTTGDTWLVNIDLDYFQSKDRSLIPEADRGDMFMAIRDLRDNKYVSAITICLSPECCGGWDMAERLAYELLDVLDVDFRLPN